MEGLSCDELKARGNELFIQEQFEQAEAFYTEAITLFDTHKVVLYTNRAACRIATKNYEGSLLDCENAISLDPTWTKAYYRKSIALDQLDRRRESFEVWQEALTSCEHTAWLLKQVKTATTAWLKNIRTVPIDSMVDFVGRYKLLTNSRERLSTMAHFWNESTQEERFHHFQFLLSVIGGEGELSELNRRVTAEMMMAMPLQNYEDLPRSRIESWCDYFRSLGIEEKTSLFKSIWDNLAASERDAVVADLKLFVARAYEMQQLLQQSSHTSLDPDLD